MLYVAGEIVVWMVAAFLLGLLVGWFVWGLPRRRRRPKGVQLAIPTVDAVDEPVVRVVATGGTAAPVGDLEGEDMPVDVEPETRPEPEPEDPELEPEHQPERERQPEV